MADETRRRIPVILDTDIGDDIDDTWALAMLLKSPEIDLRMLVTDYGNTEYRARLAAKYLEAAGRADIPVAIGVHGADNIGPQGPWAEGYDLTRYPGEVKEDGVGALIDEVMESDEQITLCCIGPMPNIREALRREPEIANRARFVGMYGSVYKGYGGKAKPDPEWNVRADVEACRAGFTAPWEMTITPLDTCGLVVLDGERYAKVRDCDDPAIRALIENYRVWARGRENIDPETHSSTLFDTVAVHLTMSTQFLTMERVGLRVTDEGHTAIDPSAKQINAAVAWIDLNGYLDYLVNRLTA